MGLIAVGMGQMVIGISEVKMAVEAGDLIVHRATGEKLVVLSWQVTPPSATAPAQAWGVDLRCVDVADTLEGLYTSSDMSGGEDSYLANRRSTGQAVPQCTVRFNFAPEALLEGNSGAVFTKAFSDTFLIAATHWMAFVHRAHEESNPVQRRRGMGILIKAVVPNVVTVYRRTPEEKTHGSS